MDAWHGKMIPCIGLKNTCMANQYVSDQTKSGKNKDLKPECLAQENLKSGQNFMQERG